MKNMTKLTVQDLPHLFTPIPDFPKPGILYWNSQDLTGVPGALTLVTDLFAERCASWSKKHGRTIDYIGGFDARGFIFGAAVAERLGIGFLQLRKKGKLPPPTVFVTYQKEYGLDELYLNEMDLAGKAVVLIDDLLATGGTAEAGCRLIEKLGGTVAAFMTVIELPFLNGRGAKLGNYPVYSVLSTIGNTLRADVSYCVDNIAETESGEFVMVKRLNNPPGFAFTGGHIDPHVSAQNTVMWEQLEETGLSIHESEFITTLCNDGRDPRGDKVSLLYRSRVFGTMNSGEPGKTEPCTASAADWEKIPPDQFVFDARKVLDKYVLRKASKAA